MDGNGGKNNHETPLKKYESKWRSFPGRGENKNIFETTTQFFIRKDVVHHPIEIPIHRLSGSSKVPENPKKNTGFLSASRVENPPKEVSPLYANVRCEGSWRTWAWVRPGAKLESGTCVLDPSLKRPGLGSHSTLDVFVDSYPAI